MDSPFSESYSHTVETISRPGIKPVTGATFSERPKSGYSFFV
jgi:hypothetical protein